MQNRKNCSLNFIIMNTLLLVYFIELVFPPITTMFSSLIVRLVCMVGWIALSFLTKRSFYAESSIHVTYVLIFYVAAVLVPYIFGEATIGNRYLDLGMIPMGYFIFCYYKECGRLKDLQKILLITSVFILLTYVDTLKALLDNPYASRSMKTSSTEAGNLEEQSIGGYSFVYFMVVVSVLLLYIFLKTKNRWIKLCAFAGTCMALFFILKANYTTALLVTLLAASVLILMSYAKKGLGNNLLLFFLVIVFFLALTNLNNIIEIFADVIPSRIAQAIMPEKNESVLQALTEEFLWDRWPVMQDSINAFLEAPLLGLVGSGKLGYSGKALQGFGQHSHILDTFALLGGVFGIVNIFVILRPLKDNKGRWIAYGKPINAAMLICMIGIYFFNNATEAIALAFGIIFPLLREHYDSENEI